MNLYENILKAESRIRPYIDETPLHHSPLLSQKYNASVLLKCEHQQKTGSFKLRGATNKVLSLTKAERSKGVVAASTGNHGKGVALAGNICGVSPSIFVPENSSAIKVQAIKALGAEIHYCEGDCLHAETKARQYAKDHGMTYISPYNDYDVIAGQGSIGVEIERQSQRDNRKLDVLFVSVGGGGLVSGIGTYLKTLNPDLKIIGCWPQNAPSFSTCLKAGHIFEVPETKTISDGTAGGVEKDAITFSLCQEILDDHCLVSEQEIAAAMKELAECENMMVEGAAGVAMAGFIKRHKQYQQMNCSIILCGRNIDFNQYIRAMA